MTEKKAAVLLAEGFEEIEALTVVDVLRRADIICDMIALGNKTVTGSHGISVIADLCMDEADRNTYDMVILPGGQPGSTHLRDSEQVIAWIRAFDEQDDKYVAAICAAPMAVAESGIAAGRKVTSFPQDFLRELLKDAEYIDDNEQLEEMVAVDRNLITSRGPATALPFAFRLVEILGKDSTPLRQGMQFDALKEVMKK